MHQTTAGDGSYFPSLLEPRRRAAERALVAVLQEAYVQGVSTRRVDELVQALGVSWIVPGPRCWCYMPNRTVKWSGSSGRSYSPTLP